MQLVRPSPNKVVWFLNADFRRFQPQPSNFDRPSDATAFIAVILAFLGLSDFTAASMREEIAFSYWSSQLPVRLFFLFLMTGYTYLFKRGAETFGEAIKYTSSSGDNLKNSLVFTWGFMEVATWFWVRISEKRNLYPPLWRKVASTFILISL